MLYSIEKLPFHIYYIFILLTSSIASAAETNNVPQWFALPRLVWGEETNGIRAGITDGDPGLNGIVVFIYQSATTANCLYIAPVDKRFAAIELHDKNGASITLKGKKWNSDLPQHIPVLELARIKDMGTRERGSAGGFRDRLYGNPSTLQRFSVQDIYKIETEGDYILTVQPVIYEYMRNKSYVSRMDLPCVSIKTHLAP